jgi:hypothetical protein
MSNVRNIVITVILCTGALAGTGCANLERNLQDPSVWQQIAEINDRYAERRYEIETGDYGEPQFIDLTGEWTFRHNGELRSNVIRHGGSGIMVIPTNGNRPVYYTEIGLNHYRSADGHTYEFSTIHTGTWRANDGSNRAIHLRRASWD